MKAPINNFHDALNEWNNGELKNVPDRFIEAIVKQCQEELQRRKIERVVQSRIDDINEAIYYCNEQGFRLDSCEDALQVWHDSAEYDTEQDERKGDDDFDARQDR